MSSRRSQVSAGLVAFRRRPHLEVLLGHPGGPYWAKKDDGAWSIPKGVVEDDRDPLAAAYREFREETGFQAAGTVVPLRPVRVKSGKVVQGWALEADFDVSAFHSIPFEMEWPPRSGRMASFPELDRLEWFPIDRALAKIIAYQKPLLLELRDLIAGKTAAPKSSPPPL
jgi:predicted NUDIX family NTP pyrophosphohydrolase